MPEAASTGITDMWMWVMVGRTSVSSQPEQLGQPLLDLLVEHRAAEQARPARVRAPGLEIGRDRRDDLGVEVEAEVVAGREVGQPVVADADHAPVDLLDDGIHHRVAGRERREVADGLKPVVDPWTA